jgi:outer membrane protein OmpA-like peptidoglycan-associated protein
MKNDSIFSFVAKNFEEHWSSISDLMSGLMIIFLFVSVAYMRSVTQEKDKIQQVVVMWNQTQENLFLDLYEEFKDDLQRWQASLNRETLSLRFEEPSVFFEAGSAQITDGFKRILDDFFPRYLEILRKYQTNIAEVRIEGHTSSEWTGTKDTMDAYFKNMELSQNRTRSVLQYCLTLSAVDQQLSWAIKTITANGLSSSSPILLDNGAEDHSLSRRVEFRVRTDAEKRIVTILEDMK